ncbi:DUF1310 family protein [Streptococcus zhangguiae]|uniref:DUF1310 family protein n=1 Tax=Streptococcus zhangguiae TaxID=2664091 RepID=A0A6I4RHK0_9STRE|nr:DUF1310 family protein [Streptococcus sp. zg-70]MWV55933.1 DUF1310 family protein [Streptococcus sp. zg-70]
MKTWLKWILGIITSLSVIIGVVVLEQVNRQEQLKQEMIKVVESEKAKAIFEKKLKRLDTNALTKNGIIKSYEVDVESVKHNPMGGFSTALIINDNKKLYVRIGLDKDRNTDKLIVYSSTESNELQDLLEERTDE